MVKKKISGQTIVIIVLTVLLLITIAFGGVYAYYSARSKKVVTGRIVMANLKISMDSGNKSDKSEIVISNGYQIIPGQPLENSPLVVRNLSVVEIYLVVVYKIDAYITDEDSGEKEYIIDDYKKPVLGLGTEYSNSVFPQNSSTHSVSNKDWIDYIFIANESDTNASEITVNETTGETCRAYRCLVSTKSYGFTGEDGEGIVVIGENKMSLAGAMGNEYQGSNIAFTFQAYAIGKDSGFDFAENEPSSSWCQKIVSATYQGQGNKFLNID